MKPEMPAGADENGKPADEGTPKGRARRPYAAPAIVGSATIEPVTLGTKPGHAPGHGC